MPHVSLDLIKDCRLGPDLGYWERTLPGCAPEELQSLLEDVIDAWSEDPLNLSRGARQASELLMRHGANPLAGTYSPMSRRLVENRTDVAIHLVNLLCSIQAQHGMVHRADDGGNALHVLLQHAPEWLGNLLESAFNNTRLKVDPNRTMSLPQFACLHPDWINEARLDGATPLHIWWRQAPELYEHGGRDAMAAFHVWDRFIYLASAGASIEAQDQSGKTVAGLMLQAVEQHGVDGSMAGPWLDHARAVQQSMVLQASSPIAPDPRKAGLRL